MSCLICTKSFSCDQFPHCQDFSDEADCDLVILPENYVLEYPPFKVDDMGRPVKVNVSVRMELLAISDISEVGQTFTAQFNLFITWLDFRMEMFNMKEDMNMNTLTAEERGSIWVPKLIFRFQYRSTRSRDTFNSLITATQKKRSRLRMMRRHLLWRREKKILNSAP